MPFYIAMAFQIAGIALLALACGLYARRHEDQRLVNWVPAWMFLLGRPFSYGVALGLGAPHLAGYIAMAALTFHVGFFLRGASGFLKSRFDKTLPLAIIGGILWWVILYEAAVAPWLGALPMHGVSVLLLLLVGLYILQSDRFQGVAQWAGWVLVVMAALELIYAFLFAEPLIQPSMPQVYLILVMGFVYCLAAFGMVLVLIARNTLELAKAKQMAESAELAKSRFLTHVSHELRIPLNTILGFAQMIQNETLGPTGSEKYKEYARSICLNGEQLLSLINDMLDMAKIEAGRSEFREERIALAEFLKKLVEDMRPEAESAGLTFQFTHKDPLPDILGDGRMLKQALLNLLSNAIKYTNAGGQVTLGAGEDAGGYCFTIADTGLGMAEQDLADALKPFVQLEAREGNMGAGLGLPLAKAIAEMHGGQLILQSQKGAGTRAIIKLPGVRILHNTGLEQLEN